MKYIAFILFFAASSARAQIKLTYQWRQVAGPVAAVIEHADSASTLVKELNVPGEYKFEFTACNDFGCSSDTCTVTVLPADVLAIDTTTKVHIERPVIKKLEIAMLDKGGEVWMQIKSPRVQKVTCQLFNSVGQLLATADIQLKTGINYASLPKPRLKGIYIFRFVTYFENVTHKMII